MVVVSGTTTVDGELGPWCVFECLSIQARLQRGKVIFLCNNVSSHLFSKWIRRKTMQCDFQSWKCVNGERAYDTNDSGGQRNV